MALNYPNAIGALTADERILFYEFIHSWVRRVLAATVKSASMPGVRSFVVRVSGRLLAHNLTVVIRGIWSDDLITDAEKVDRMKWINEILHRVTSKIRVLRLSDHEWSEEDSWGDIQHWVSQNRALESAIDAAVSWSYESVRPIKTRS